MDKFSLQSILSETVLSDSKKNCTLSETVRELQKKTVLKIPWKGTEIFYNFCFSAMN
jgi:hypothetical protein